jgi:hypothetical protein
MSKELFLFQTGTGVVRSKVAADAIMHFGQVALPEFGQCFLDAVRGKETKAITLTAKQAKTRKVVATLTIPANGVHAEGETCEGLAVAVNDDGKPIRGKRWKIVATLRHGEAGWYLALRLPEVKIQHANAF